MQMRRNKTQDDPYNLVTTHHTPPSGSRDTDWLRNPWAGFFLGIRIIRAGSFAAGCPLTMDCHTRGSSPVLQLSTTFSIA